MIGCPARRGEAGGGAIWGVGRVPVHDACRAWCLLLALGAPSPGAAACAMLTPMPPAEPTRATRQLQAVLISFCVLATISLLILYRVQPAIYRPTLGRVSDRGVALLLVALVGFEAVLILGMLQRWRWLFWLLVVAFGASLVHLPLALLRLGGVIGGATPLWYDFVRAMVGCVQGAIAGWMVVLYRRYGVWACRPH